VNSIGEFFLERCGYEGENNGRDKRKSHNDDDERVAYSLHKISPRALIEQETENQKPHASKNEGKNPVKFGFYIKRACEFFLNNIKLPFSFIINKIRETLNEINALTILKT